MGDGTRTRVALYARVSRDDGEMEPLNQLLPAQQHCQERGWRIVKEYADKTSAADLRGRAAWRELMVDAERRRFDVVVVWKLDRAFRSTLHAADSLERLRKAGVSLVSVTEPWADGTSASGELMRTILIAFAAFEREQIRERTRAGLARAAKQGRRGGRRRKLNGEFEALRGDVVAGTISRREAARRLGVSARTIGRALRHKGGHSAPSLGPVTQGFADATCGD